MSIESQKDSLRRMLKFSRQRIAELEAEAERQKAMVASLSERLYLAAECLAADLRQRIEAFLASVQR